jgi:hypothetical protein
MKLVCEKPKVCTKEYRPVCGQSNHETFIEEHLTPQTYTNMCLLKADGATLVNYGKCISDYDEQEIKKIDMTVEDMIKKIDTQFRKIPKKIEMIWKMIQKLQKKAKMNTSSQGATNYMIKKLQLYLTRFND